MPEETMCACGKPLHYSDAKMQELVELTIAHCGPDIEVTVEGRSWWVPRHYIALHGLKAAELPTLGFPEIPRWKRKKEDGSYE